MAGGDEAVSIAGDSVQAPLRLVRDVTRLSAAGFEGDFKKDCTDLSRRIALLAHLLEEIRDFKRGFSNFVHSDAQASSSSASSCLSDLTVAIQAAKRLLSSAGNFDSKISSVSLNLAELDMYERVYMNRFIVS